MMVSSALDDDVRRPASLRAPSALSRVDDVWTRRVQERLASVAAGGAASPRAVVDDAPLRRPPPPSSDALSRLEEGLAALDGLGSGSFDSDDSNESDDSHGNLETCPGTLRKLAKRLTEMSGPTVVVGLGCGRGNKPNLSPEKPPRPRPPGPAARDALTITTTTRTTTTTTSDVDDVVVVPRAPTPRGPAHLRSRPAPGRRRRPRKRKVALPFSKTRLEPIAEAEEEEEEQEEEDEDEDDYECLLETTLASDSSSSRGHPSSEPDDAFALGDDSVYAWPDEVRDKGPYHCRARNRASPRALRALVLVSFLAAAFCGAWIGAGRSPRRERADEPLSMDARAWSDGDSEDVAETGDHFPETEDRFPSAPTAASSDVRESDRFSTTTTTTTTTEPAPSPSRRPTRTTSDPTRRPTSRPTSRPTDDPTTRPTTQPTTRPTSTPSRDASLSSTVVPAVVKPPPSPPPPSPLSFYVLPPFNYFPQRPGRFRERLRTVPDDALFVAHLGQFHRIDANCTDDSYAAVDAELRSVDAVIQVLPADNDFQNCPDPDRAWESWTRWLLRDEDDDALGLARQRPARPENFSLRVDDVLVVGLTLVGGALPSNEVQSTRMRENLEWTISRLDDDVRGVVVLGHSPPLPRHRAFFGPLAEAWPADVPLVYVHGGGGATAATTRLGHREDWWRVQTGFGASAPARLRVTVSGSGTGIPFLFQFEEEP